MNPFAPRIALEVASQFGFGQLQAGPIGQGTVDDPPGQIGGHPPAGGSALANGRADEQLGFFGGDFLPFLAEHVLDLVWENQLGDRDGRGPPWGQTVWENRSV